MEVRLPLQGGHPRPMRPPAGAATGTWFTIVQNLGDSDRWVPTVITGKLSTVHPENLFRVAAHVLVWLLAVGPT